MGELNKNPSLNGTELPLHARSAVPGEWVDKYETALRAMKPAAENLDGHAQDWRSLHDEVVGVRDEFLRWLDQTLNEPDGWRGQTAMAIVNKAKESLSKLDELAMAAYTMSILIEAFGNVITGTRNLIVGRENEYINEVLKCSENSTPETRKDKENQLNLFAQEVINTLYNPSISGISGKHPEISTTSPTVGVPGGAPPGLGFPGGSGGPAGPGAIKPGGLGMPELPSPNGLTGPTDPASGQGMPTMPAGSPQGAGDAAKGAGNAAGQGANAANQALDQATKGGQKNPSGGLPGGVLTPAAHGLNRPTKATGSGGARGASGAAPRGPSLGKPAAQLTPVSKAAASAAVPASRAGVSGGNGAPVAGAPAAGHQGGKAGKEHRVSKALRHTKHGQDVIGEADAVVPVVGDESEAVGPRRPG
ncbi:hypothetical protein [Mycobacterium sp. 852002-51163_SCH5372311]|uniref:hypothetical protein n=1 Tax=Mycobacterium sp. 852002-51163_SCH5372311 TaxID=1834097 RepID=UPI0012E71CE1|nr:hypothetical protein [Mycobacterium sp. 852002-51163_SCH5372311]